MADRDNRLGKAKSLGAPPAVRSDKLGAADLDDLYRFNLLNKSSLGLDLSGVKKANFDVEVYSFKVPLSQIPKKIRDLDFRQLKGNRNKYLQLVGASKKGGTASENIQTDLEAGEYVVRVTRRKGDSKYRLNLTSTPVPVPTPNPTPGPTPGPGPTPTPGPGPTPGPVPTPGPSPVPSQGNSFDTAFSGTIPTTTALQGNFTATDKLDYYKFTVGRGDYQFNLSGDAKVEFFDANQGVVTTTYQAGKTKFIQPLDQGTYYLKVSQQTTASYSVTASKLQDGVTNTIPSSSTVTLTPTLTKINTSNQTFYVVDGGKDSPVDYYRFNVPEFSKFEAELRNMSGNLDVRLFNVNDQGTGTTKDTPYNSQSTTAETVIPGPLDAGDYILQVFAPTGQGSTYDLSMSLESPNGEPYISADVNSDPGKGSGSNNLVEVGNAAFFVAKDSSGQTALYRTTGTIDKLKRLKNFESVDSFTYATNDAFYFTGSANGSGKELWQCTADGTVTQATSFTSPTVEIKNTAKTMAAVGNYLYFVANDGTGFNLNRANLSSPTPSVDSTFANNLTADNLGEMTVVNNALFFAANGGGDGRELWRIQNAGANTPGTLENINLNAAAGSGSFPTSLTVVGNDTLYLLASRDDVNDSKGDTMRLVKLSNLSGTIQATNITLGDNQFVEDSELFLFQGDTGITTDDILYFTAIADDGTTGNKGKELMKLANPLAATSSSTMTLVKDIRLDGPSSLPSNLVEYDGKLYFVADDENGAKIWHTDGTAANTMSIDQGLLEDSTSVSYSLPSTKQLVVVDNTLYLTASEPTTGLELWQVKGTELSLVQDINLTPDANNPNNTQDSKPQQLTAIGGSLFFIADDTVSGSEVWSVTPSNDA